MVIEIPSQVNRAIEILKSNGHSAFVVGGAVRNILMGIVPNDWDIATSALPNDTLKIFSDFKTIETGLRHGTVTVIIDEMSLEITTFRIESGYSDKRHPDKVVFTSDITEDLARRDFTVNAIAYSFKTGLIDPFGGEKDLQNQLIRTVGNADRRFEEDALRILRALRFSSVLGFQIDSETAESIHKNFGLLKNVSSERIFEEFCKLLCGKNVGKILREYEDVVFFVFPKLTDMKNCAQNHERHIYDVWEHTVCAVENVAPVPKMRFAMLFHDSGKPQCKTTDQKGIDHFYLHGEAGSQIAFEALTNLKASTKFKKDVCRLVEFHEFLPDKISKNNYKKFIARYGIGTIEMLFDIREADVSAQNPKFLEQSLSANKKGLEIVKEIRKKRSCLSIKNLAVNGDDLEKIGIEPSPKMGKILKTLLNEVMDEKIENTKEALLSRAEELKQN